KLAQFLALLGLDEVRRVSRIEGAGDLGVQIHTVDDDHHRWVLQDWIQPQFPGGEEHEEGLPRTLEVPDEALLRITGDHALDDLVGPFVLLVTGNNLYPALLLVGRVCSETGQEV